MKMNTFKGYSLMVCLGIMLCMAHLVMAQGNPEIHTLTRSRVWYASYGAAVMEQGNYRTYLSYPGYYDAADMMYDGRTHGAVWTFITDGDTTNVSGYLRPSRLAEAMQVVEQNTLVNNYNFVQSRSEPEEYMMSAYEFNATDQDGRLGNVRIRTKSMAWSVPKYDDFIIEEYTATNNDSEPIYDFYFYYNIPFSHEWGKPEFLNDKEYVWDEEINTFIFYDDTEWPWNEAQPNQYVIPPGNETGDAGDPGNILVSGSIDRKLYGPQVTTMMMTDVPVNKLGADSTQVWMSIYMNRDTPAGESDDMPWREFGSTGWGGFYAGIIDDITHPQVKRSWRDLWNDPANPKDGSMDGNLFERQPLYWVAVGPYDLEPGESVSWKRIWLFGEMDRNVSQLGGLEATRTFKEKGIENLKANYQAAMELINNNYVLPDNAYPPPTPGLPPFVGSDSEILKVEPYAIAETGESGFDLTWTAVHDDYTDPGTGESDFAGYRIYRSEIDITGPWEEILELTPAQADEYRDGDRITYRINTETGVPYRFAVTTYDKHGLESGMTAYSYYPESAKIAPSNTMDDIVVVPNPFKQKSGFLDAAEDNRLAFVNIPARCTIRIYTLAGDLVKTLNHDGFGATTWGSSEERNYMLTEFRENIMPGLYLFHVESHVSGHEGEEYVGKFMVVK